VPKKQSHRAVREAQMEIRNSAFKGGLQSMQPHREQPAENKPRAACLHRECCPSCSRSAEEALWKKTERLSH